LIRQLHCAVLSPQEQGQAATDISLGAHTLLKLLEQDWLLADHQYLVTIGKYDSDLSPVVESYPGLCCIYILQNAATARSYLM